MEKMNLNFPLSADFYKTQSNAAMEKWKLKKIEIMEKNYGSKRNTPRLLVYLFTYMILF